MKMSSEQERELLKEIQDNLQKAIDEDFENRTAALADLEFIGVEGAQWPSDIRAARAEEGKPCLTINKIPAFISQVVGNQRINRPAIKVIPVDSKGDPAVANILSGWIKHVQHISKSDVAVDHGFEHSVSCGYGALRVVTEYTDEKSFDQDAYIKKVDNALAVYWGKHSEYDCSDAPWCILIADMDNGEFKAKYKSEPMEFNTANSQFVQGWCTKNDVRLAEYFKKERVSSKLYVLTDGRIVVKLEQGDVVDKERVVDSYKVMWYLVSGNKVLDSRQWVGKKYIPIIPIWGKELNVGGKVVVKSLIRDAKDSQRMFNYWNSTDTEVITLQPKVPYLVTPKQISGHESMWKDSNRKNFPFLYVNFDEKAPGWPHRETPPQASSAMLERIQHTDQEMRDTIGLQKASMGMQSNERSGKAIIERKKEGDVGTYCFVDNLARSIEHLGRVLIDIAPGILDTNRVIRLGLDSGEQDFVEINKEVMQDTGVKQILNDPSVGTYDVVVTVGPGFSTQRTEARQSMSEFIQYYPQAAPLIGDLFAKAMDWSGADEFAKRLEFLLPPAIREEKAMKEAMRNGTEPPSPAQPDQPPPLEVMKLEEGKAKIHLDEVKLEQEKVELEIKKVQLQKEKAELAETHGRMQDEMNRRGGMVQNESE